MMHTTIHRHLRGVSQHHYVAGQWQSFFLKPRNRLSSKISITSAGHNGYGRSHDMFSYITHIFLYGYSFFSTRRVKYIFQLRMILCSIKNTIGLGYVPDEVNKRCQVYFYIFQKELLWQIYYAYTVNGWDKNITTWWNIHYLAYSITVQINPLFSGSSDVTMRVQVITYPYQCYLHVAHVCGAGPNKSAFHVAIAEVFF